MAKKIQVIVETGKDMFACFMVGSHDGLTGLHGDGKTARKAISNFYTCYEEEKQFCQTEDKAAPELEFEFIFDIGAFFNYYLINVSAFAEYAGMNASLLRQYACGLKSPTKATIDKIRAAVDNYRKDIATGLLIDRPVPQYI